MRKATLVALIGALATAAALAFGGAARGGPTADMSASIGPGFTTTPGRAFSLFFTARNNGPERAQGARVTVTLTRGAATFVAISGTTGWSCSSPAAGAEVDVVACDIGQLSAGAAGEFELVLRSKPSYTGTISAIVRAFSSTADAVTANDHAQTFVRVVPAADIGVAVQGPPSAPANTRLTYHVTARNHGPSFASSVFLAVSVPAQTSYVSVQEWPWSCSFHESSAEVRCRGALASGEAQTFELDVFVEPTAVGSITTRARVVYDNDPNAGNNDGALALPVTFPRADLAVAVNAFDFTGPGATVNYAIRVTNNGPDPAYSPHIRVPVPAQTTDLGFLSQSGWGCALEGDATTHSCGGPTLAPGASAEFYFSVRVDAGATGTITFTATASSASADPVPGNEVGTKSTAVAEAADIGIALAGPSKTPAGSEITYEVTVTNNGPAAAHDVSWFAEDYPGTFVSLGASGAWECNPPDPGATSPVGCNLATLDAGAVSTFELVVQIASDEAGPITNGVVVSSLSDPNGVNDEAYMETEIGEPGPEAPGAPSALTAVAGAGQAQLAWSPPATDGGSPLTGYDVYLATIPGGQGDTPVNPAPLPPDATVYTATGLLNGQTYHFTVRALNAVGRSAPSNEASAVPFAPSSVAYDGQQLVAAGFPLTASAIITGPAECVVGRAVTFSLDRDPLLGVAAPYAAGAASADADGRATTVPVPTGDWLPGLYTVTATVVETAGCGGATGTASLTVGSLGQAAGGSAWYSLTGSGRVGVTFDVRRAPGGAGGYVGALRLVNDGRWRLRGSLTSYLTSPGGLGIATGAGELSWWNSALNGGRGDWELASDDVPYTIEFTATGTNRKTTPGTFGIRIEHTPVFPQPTPLPSSAPRALGGGAITVEP